MLIAEKQWRVFVILGMHYTDFLRTVSAGQIPKGLSIQLQSLWYDARGDWHKAHDLINNLGDPASAHIHAYLHRKEGDQGNARYWYNRAGKAPCTLSLTDEWETLVTLYGAG